jgi:hypothetical protein
VFELPSVVAISATPTQRGCGVEMSRGRNDSGVDHRPRSRRGRGSAAPTTLRAKTFGRLTEFKLAATATDRSEHTAVEPSIPLAQNVFAIRRSHASITVIRAHLSPKTLGPPNFGHHTKAAKIASAWESDEL